MAILRFYMGKWPTGILYLLRGGIFGIGNIYVYRTLNIQISKIHQTF